VIISGKDSNAVLLAEDDWILINETLNLLSVPSMRESIAKGMTQSIEKCASELDW
jgi:PHD/YefM family antitoxin component YafN of YafNO toxin-antitoxin module